MAQDRSSSFSSAPSSTHITMANFPVLPPELRTHILSHTVTFTYPLVRPRAGETLSSLEPQLGILLVNKTIHEEAASLFYELNRFRLFLPTSGFEHTLPVYTSDYDFVLDELLEDKIDTEEVDDVDALDPKPQSSLDTSDSEDKLERALAVPPRYINRLRDVIFHSRLPGCWPNGPLIDAALGPGGLGEKEVAQLLDRIAAHSGILNNISIELQRTSTVIGIEWDPDPLVLLMELDRDRRFSRIVATLPQLRRLEIWKARSCDAWYMASFGGQFVHEGGIRVVVHVIARQWSREIDVRWNWSHCISISGAALLLPAHMYTSPTWVTRLYGPLGRVHVRWWDTRK
ncbi:hypothetical protein C8Q74DRAFT_445210 [Fomes fomentarius]|nr:hypothetical protein C8Q74DRAFT_445210 [Fomes fomentarius]